MAELDAISKEAMMDLIRESSFAQYLTRQGEEKAFEQGIEQGIERGLQRSILAALEIRFDVSSSDPLAARIAKIDGEERLNQLLRTAVQAPSLDAFCQLLNDESG